MGVSSSERGETFTPNGAADRFVSGMLVMHTSAAIENGHEQPLQLNLPEDLQSITGTPAIPVVEVPLTDDNKERLRRVVEEWGSDSKAVSGDTTVLRDSPDGHINVITVGYNGRVEEDARVFVPYFPSAPEKAIVGAPSTLARVGVVFMAMSHK